MQLRKVLERLLAVAAVLLLVPLHVAAQDDDVIDDPFANYDSEELFGEEIKEPDWIPSLRFGIGVMHHQGLGVLTTPGWDVNGDGDKLDANEQPGIQTFAGRVDLLGTARTAYDGPPFSFGAEIMGPPFEDVIGDMRLFVTGGVRDMLEGNTAVVRKNDEPPSSLVGSSLRTQGKFKIDRWYEVGVGAAFQLPIEGFNIKLKPSVNWMVMDFTYTSFLVQAIQNNPGTPTPVNINFPRTDERSDTNHLIAPRIELDGEIYRAGPISVGVYGLIETQIVIAGDTEHQAIAFSCAGNGPNGCANIDGSAGVLQFDYDRDSIIYYGGAGIRISWVGGP